LPVVRPASEPQSNDLISVLALHTPGVVHYPFAATNSGSVPPSMRVVSSEVSAMSAAINGFLHDPAAPPLTLSRSQPYPMFLMLLDALGLLLAAIIVRYWTAPLCHSAFLGLAGASPQRAAEPILATLGAIAGLISNLTQRRRAGDRKTGGA